jgi:hypothetical protein
MRHVAGLRALIAFSVASAALPGAAADRFPPRLRCVNVECLPGGIPEYCTVGLAGDVELRSEAADTRKREGALVLDFSEDERTSRYTFQAADLASLRRAGQRISGQYEEGLDRAEGYHLRARIRLECFL